MRIYLLMLFINMLRSKKLSDYSIFMAQINGLVGQMMIVIILKTLIPKSSYKSHSVD